MEEMPLSPESLMSSFNLTPGLCNLQDE